MHNESLFNSFLPDFQLCYAVLALVRSLDVFSMKFKFTYTHTVEQCKAYNHKCEVEEKRQLLLMFLCCSVTFARFSRARRKNKMVEYAFFQLHVLHTNIVQCSGRERREEEIDRPMILATRCVAWNQFAACNSFGQNSIVMFCVFESFVNFKLNDFELISATKLFPCVPLQLLFLARLGGTKRLPSNYFSLPNESRELFTHFSLFCFWASHKIFKNFPRYWNLQVVAFHVSFRSFFYKWSAHWKPFTHQRASKM